MLFWRRCQARCCPLDLGWSASRFSTDERATGSGVTFFKGLKFAVCTDEEGRPALLVGRSLSRIQFRAQEPEERACCWSLKRCLPIVSSLPKTLPAGAHRQGGPLDSAVCYQVAATFLSASVVLVAKFSVSVSHVSAQQMFIDKETSRIHGTFADGNILTVGAESIGFIYSETSGIQRLHHHFQPASQQSFFPRLIVASFPGSWDALVPRFSQLFYLRRPGSSDARSPQNFLG